MGPLEDVGINWRMCGSSGGCVGPLEDVGVHWRMCGSSGGFMGLLEDLWVYWRIYGSTGGFMGLLDRREVLQNLVQVQVIQHNLLDKEKYDIFLASMVF